MWFVSFLGKVPLDRGGESDDARALPVGVEALVVADVESDREGNSGLHGVDRGDEIQIGTDCLFLRLERGERGGEEKGGEETAGEGADPVADGDANS